MEDSSVGVKEKNVQMTDSNGNGRRGFSVSFSEITVPTTCSPEVPSEKIRETPEYIRKRQNIEMSPVALFAKMCSEGTKNHVGSTTAEQEKLSDGISWSEVSLELPQIPETDETLLSLNVGGVDEAVTYEGKDFKKDNFYIGGDIIRSDAKSSDGMGHALYSTARFGDFSYEFPDMEGGVYYVDLHLAEIEFITGPSEMRVFDVYIQQEKAVSAIDIYAKVGPNHPLILPNLEAVVVGQKGLSIRFEGLVGKPIVCGISIRRRGSSTEDENIHKRVRDLISIEGSNEENLNMANYHDCRECKRNFDFLMKEQLEMRTALEAAKCKNELKSQECEKAWASLKELQTELMRKSMHVGSLAFAVEGQVKEKSRWCQGVEDLCNKFKLMKIEHTKLTEEALELKSFLVEMFGRMSSILPSVDNHINLERNYKDLKLRFIEESKERKDLYNRMIELKGNIRVFCRCRPLSAEEIAKGDDMSLDFESAKDGELAVKTNGIPKKVFKFDAVFSRSRLSDVPL